MITSAKEFRIVVRVANLARRFHSMDSSPFRERDLADEADEFIAGWAQDAGHRDRFVIVVRLPEDECTRQIEGNVRSAVEAHFFYRVLQCTRRLRQLFGDRWRTLLVGLPVLAGSLRLSRFVGERLDHGMATRTVAESLLILGWVANWRPLEIFLYEWWPIVRRRSLYRRLAAAAVRL